MKQFSPDQIAFSLLVAAMILAAVIYRHFASF
jgi:hypothetical protein